LRRIVEILTKALDALWQVLLVGVLLGVGLPALFALGVRSLNTSRQLVSVGSAGEEVTKPSPAGLAGGVVCFGLCILAVLFGIVVIVYGKQLFGV
jgi:hypothetical protein